MTILEKNRGNIHGIFILPQILAQLFNVGNK